MYVNVYISTYVFINMSTCVHITTVVCSISALTTSTADLSLIQQEVDALEELSRQLFLETVDLQATKVMCRKTCSYCSEVDFLAVDSAVVSAMIFSFYEVLCHRSSLHKC